MDFGVVALIALGNTLSAFLIWALPRFAVVLAVALGRVALFGFPLVVHVESRFWLFLPLEAGGYVAAFFKRRWFVPLIMAGAVVEVWPWLR
jgi:hypothetical protein